MDYNVFGVDNGFDMQGTDPIQALRMSVVKDLGELSKSMEAGHPVPSYSGGGSASPLFRQELVDQLFIQCESDKLVKFFPEVYKNSKPLNSSVVEYRKQTAVGDTNASIFQDEGIAGPLLDSVFTTHYQKMRWISEKRAVTYQASMTSNTLAPNGSVLAKAMADAATHIGTRLEHNMFYGDQTVNTRGIDGLKAIVKNNNEAWQTADLRGAELSLENVGFGQEAVQDNVFGRLPTKLWASARTLKVLSDEHGDRVKAVYMENGKPPAVAGQMIRQYMTQLGQVDVDWSYYLSATRKKLRHSSATSTTAPATPTITSTAVANDAASKFGAADAATYVYKVVAIGNTTASGASAPVAANAQAVAAGEKCTITIAAAGNTNVAYYQIYRHVKGNSTDWYLIGEVVCAGGNNTTVFVDYNEEIPGTCDAFLIDPSVDVLQWREMMPYSMIPLPQIDLLKPYAFAMFGTLICPIPAMIRFKNIKHV